MMPMKRELTNVAAAAVAMMITASASGMGHRPLLTLPEISTTMEGRAPPLAVRLEADGIDEIVAQSAIISADTDRVLLESPSVGVSVIDSTEFGDGALNDLSDELVVARKGDVVTLGPLHEISLAVGFYAERLLFTLLINGSSVEVSDYRYFKITATGVEQSSLEEYSNAALKQIKLPDGTIDLQGSWSPAPPGASEPTFRDAIVVEGPARRAPSIVPPNSERDEL